MAKNRNIDDLRKKIEELDEKIYQAEKNKNQKNKLSELRLQKMEYEDQLYDIAN